MMGSIARMDEQGSLYLLGRKNYMLFVSGFNVFPNEVDEVVILHSDVLQSAFPTLKREKR